MAIRKEIVSKRMIKTSLLTSSSRGSSKSWSKYLSKHFVASRFLQLITVVVILISLHLTTLRQPVDASLIQIYHKYRPKLEQDSMNASSSRHYTQSTIGTSDQQQQQQQVVGLEYTSPMKRIMELISHHSPMIVVSSGLNSNENPTIKQSELNIQQVPIASSGSHIESLPLTQQPVSYAQSSLLNPVATDRQHWTLVDTNPIVDQPILATQQQQLIQSTVPYEHYYLDSNQLNGQQNQYAVMPQNLVFSPAIQQQIAYQPVSSQTGSNYQHFQQQQPQQLHLNNQEDRIQPVFLTSYVPEVALQPQSGPQNSNILPLIEQRPNSIQHQINYPQMQPVSSSSSKSDEENPINKESIESDNNDSSKSEEPDENVVNNIEEPTSVVQGEGEELKKSRKNEEQDEPTSGGSGSMSYEDKYDSDKEEPALVASKNYKTSKQLSDGAVLDGLVNVGLNDDCLQCICRASSGCDHLLRCITRGAEETFCGPFQLTEQYWKSAGSPGDAANNFQAFEDCANEADCAVETVTNYMKKYHKDCDGDEQITCMDYARLHRLKPSECHDTDKLVDDFDAYWPKFQRCAEGYNRSRNGDDEDI